MLKATPPRYMYGEVASPLEIPQQLFCHPPLPHIQNSKCTTDNDCDQYFHAVVFVCRVYRKVNDDGGKQCELFVLCVELYVFFNTNVTGS